MADDTKAEVVKQAAGWLSHQTANTISGFLLIAVAVAYGFYQIRYVEPERNITLEKLNERSAKAVEKIGDDIRQLGVSHEAVAKAGMEHGEKVSDKRVKELLDAMEKRQAIRRLIDPAATADVGPKGINGSQ